VLCRLGGLGGGLGVGVRLMGRLRELEAFVPRALRGRLFGGVRVQRAPIVAMNLSLLVNNVRV